ncbi:hypothetical protein PFISCL1PPCAC_7609, partial [Pristionchus fissidentatus]
SPFQSVEIFALRQQQMASDRSESDCASWAKAPPTAVIRFDVDNMAALHYKSSKAQDVCGLPLKIVTGYHLQNEDGLPCVDAHIMSALDDSSSALYELRLGV